MAKQRPTLAAAKSWYLTDESTEVWRHRLHDEGFNWLDASPDCISSSAVPRHVEASLGLIVLNREIITGEERQVHPLEGTLEAIKAARQFELPIYLTAPPAVREERESWIAENLADHYTLIVGNDLGVIWERLPQERPA